MANLLRAEFVRNSKVSRSYHTHLSNGNNKPLCGVNRRTFGCSDGIKANWIAVDGERPTCPQCDRIAKRRMTGGDAA